MSGIFDQVINYAPPSLLLGTVTYKGTWSAATNTPTLPNPPSSITNGNYYVVSAAGTQFSLSFNIGDWIISNGSAWEKVDNTDAVSSVFGRTGAVVGVSTDYSSVGITATAVGASSPSTGAFTTLSSTSTTTLNSTTIPASKTLVVTTDKISVLAATTSAELAGVISDETGSGSLVFATLPTFGATGVKLSGSTSGTTTVLSGATAGTSVLTLPVATDTLVGKATTDTLTNKTLTSPTITGGALNGTLGATTPSSVAATTGTFSSTLGVTGVATLGNGAILGTPASGTVTNLTGTASININGTVGATTPSTIAATTGTFDAAGTADPAILVGAAGTGVNAGTVTLRGGSGTGGGGFVRFTKNATAKGYVGNESAINGNTSDDLSVYGVSNVRVYASNTQVGTFTSTGLNSTAIGATTPSTIAGTTGTFTGAVTVDPSSGISIDAINNAATYALRIRRTNTTNRNWGMYVNSGGLLQFDDITGAVTPLSLSATGAAITGTLSATGQIQTPYGSFATQAIQVGDSSYGLYIDSGIFHFKNANGGTFNFRNAGNTGNTVSIDSTGLGVTGTLSTTGTITTNGGSFLSNSASSHTFYQTTPTTGAQSFIDNLRNGSSFYFRTSVSTGADTNPLIISSAGLAVTGQVAATQSASNTASANFVSSHASTPSGISISFSGATPNDATQMFLTCGDTTNTKFQLRSNGGLGNYSANNANLSDRRLKENFVSFTQSASEIINRLEVTQFNYIGQKRTVLGVVAQQVETVAPWLVESSGFGETPKDGIPYKSIYQTDLEFLVIKALQEQNAELQSLRKRLAALESK